MCMHTYTHIYKPYGHLFLMALFWFPWFIIILGVYLFNIFKISLSIWERERAQAHAWAGEAAEGNDRQADSAEHGAQHGA